MAMPVTPCVKPQESLTITFPNCAGCDVGASAHYVAVPPHKSDTPVRKFGVMTDDIVSMADWLIECGVTHVALESTGVYWIPVYDILEQRGLTVWLIDTHQIKYAPGRKSDIQDCQWIQRLMSFGLLRPSFRPPEQVCALRQLTRYRAMLIVLVSGFVLRMQKDLIQMNIQLNEVLSDVVGVTGMAFIRAIVGGERDPKVLAHLRGPRIRAEKEEIERALTGNWREEHLFTLRISLELYDEHQKKISECDQEIAELLGKQSKHNVDIGKPPRHGSKARAEFDLRQQLANWAGVDLTCMNGLGVGTVLTILTEIGTDLSRFATVKHFCSWLGLAPGNKISGGKVLSSKTKRSANRARQAFKMAAMTLSHSHCFLGAYYRRLCSRKDKPTANTAAAHKLARIFYFMITKGQAFVEQSQEQFEVRYREQTLFHLGRQAKKMGYKIVVDEKATTP